MTDQEGKLDVTRSSEAASPERWSPLGSLRDEIDRIFDDIDPFGWHLPARPRGPARTPFARAWQVAAPMDLAECDDGYALTVELPGMSMDDVNIRVLGGALVIEGEKREVHEDSDRGFVHSERRFGSFRRVLRLPQDVDEAAISATYADGVLTVALPRSEAARSEERRIDVTAA